MGKRTQVIQTRSKSVQFFCQAAKQGRAYVKWKLYIGSKSPIWNSNFARFAFGLFLFLLPLPLFLFPFPHQSENIPIGCLGTQLLGRISYMEFRILDVRQNWGPFSSLDCCLPSSTSFIMIISFEAHTIPPNWHETWLLFDTLKCLRIRCSRRILYSMVF